MMLVLIFYLRSFIYEWSFAKTTGDLKLTDGTIKEIKSEHTIGFLSKNEEIQICNPF